MEITKSYNENSVRNYDEKFIQKYTQAINKLKFAKKSFKRGYLSKEIQIRIKDYTGKYGKGKTIEYQTKKSNQYHIIEYWIQ